MMNLRKINWVKAVLMLVLTACFLCASAEMAKMVRYNYSSWIVNRWNVQEKVYEALSLLSIACIFLLICVSCFFASLRSLVHCFFPPKGPSVFARLAARYGKYPALISFVVFGVLLIIQLVLGYMIGNTPEVSEVPATLRYRIISCWNGVPLVLAFETTVVMLVSWIQNKRRPTGKCA